MYLIGSTAGTSSFGNEAVLLSEYVCSLHLFNNSTRIAFHYIG